MVGGHRPCRRQPCPCTSRQHLARLARLSHASLTDTHDQMGAGNAVQRLVSGRVSHRLCRHGGRAGAEVFQMAGEGCRHRVDLLSLCRLQWAEMRGEHRGGNLRLRLDDRQLSGQWAAQTHGEAEKCGGKTHVSHWPCHESRLRMGQHGGLQRDTEPRFAKQPGLSFCHHHQTGGLCR